MPDHAQQPQRILAIPVNGIGDNLMALPALYRIRQKYPQAQLHLAANACNGAAAMLEMANGIDRIVPFAFDTRRRFPYLHFYLSQWPRLRREIRSSHYDLALCISANRLRRNLLNAANAPLTPVTNSAQAESEYECKGKGEGEGEGHSLNPYIAWHKLADALGAPALHGYGKLLKDTAEATAAPERYGLARNGYLIISLSGKADSRSYRRVDELLQKIRQTTNLPLVLLGAAGPQIAVTQGIVDLRGHTDLASANALCAHCRAALCADGGLLYVLTSWAKPVLGLFGPIHSRYRTPPAYPAAWLALDTAAPLQAAYQRSSDIIPAQADINSHCPQVVADAFCKLLGGGGASPGSPIA